MLSQALTTQSPATAALPGWTDVRVQTLKSLWSDGLSASQVARRLGGGATRSAVLGKIFRLGLCGRAAAASRSLPSKPLRPKGISAPSDATVQKRHAKTPRATAKGPPQTKPAAVIIEAHPEAPGLTSSVLDLGAHTCKWPIGDPRSPSFSFCGRPAEGPYCVHHHRVAHQPRKARPLETDAGLVELIGGSQFSRAA